MWGIIPLYSAVVFLVKWEQNKAAFLNACAPKQKVMNHFLFKACQLIPSRSEDPFLHEDFFPGQFVPPGWEDFFCVRGARTFLHSLGSIPASRH